MPGSGRDAADFTSLVEARARVASGSEREAIAGVRARSVHAIGSGLEAVRERPAEPPRDAAASLARAYAEEQAPATPRALPDCDPETIARELGLTPALSARELERIRRDFALASHPDRALPWQRELATRRMSLANMLIDQALAAKKRGS
jgi:hypothetical protein